MLVGHPAAISITTSSLSCYISRHNPHRSMANPTLGLEDNNLLRRLGPVAKVDECIGLFSPTELSLFRG
jgi:hypothetical protein